MFTCDEYAKVNSHRVVMINRQRHETKAPSRMIDLIVKIQSQKWNFVK